jgi:thymidylate synthase (FAD)
VTDHEIQFRSDMKVTLIDAMGDDLLIARAAWRNKNRQPKSEHHLPMLLKKMVAKKHGSPFEFGAMVLEVECPLFVVAQFQRHRIGFSYSQDSARYREMLPHFYVPDKDRTLVNSGTHMDPVFLTPDDVLHWNFSRDSVSTMTYAWERYATALEAGIAEEIARIMLPVSTYTGFWVQMNPRSIMNFLQLRVQDERNTYDTRPQYEIEQVAKQIEAFFAARWPITHQKFNEHGRVAP